MQNTCIKSSGRQSNTLLAGYFSGMSVHWYGPVIDTEDIFYRHKYCLLVSTKSFDLQVEPAH
jgi:hypothetical protein